MTPVGVTMRRTVGFARNFPSTALAIGGFLAAVGVMFVFNLRAAEGRLLSLASVWTASVAPVLPLLAAVLSMDVWSDERLSGRMELLLTAAVPERDLMTGKFLGVCVMMAVSVVASLVAALSLVHHNAPVAFAAARFIDFLPGMMALCLQGALWCAVSVAVSAFFRHAAVAAVVSCVLLVVLPRGLWAMFMECAPQGRTAFGEMPLDAHVTAFSSGTFSSGTVVAYVAFAIAALFVGTKRIETLRLVGRRAAGARFMSFAVMILAMVFAVVLTALAYRLDFVADIPFGSGDGRISQRTRNIIAESQGTMTVTCLLPRNDSRFRSVAHTLRSLRREAEAQGGVEMSLRFVDPRWDFSAAQRLARIGIDKPSVAFELGRRRTVLALEDGLTDRNIASAMLRLVTPPHRNSIYWTSGHGEASFDSYGAFGMSDIARELSRDGFKNFTIDLTGDVVIPADCALIVIAGCREDLSRVESERLGSYLKQGGRLLVMMDSPEGGGLASLLSAWGIRASSTRLVSAKTLSGGDVVASDFSNHVVVAPLKGTQVVLEHPLTFVQSSAAGGTGADRIEFSPLVMSSEHCLAVATERGGATGEDLALRPTRIVVIGDSFFAMNGPLASRANANKDFFLNCVAYLAGTGAMTGGGFEGEVLLTGMDRRAWTSFAVQSGLVVPGVLFLIMFGYVVSRRRRS